ncbi:hypothetical protein [Streptomyces sp. NPDC088775]|uniref:hypothetical protein n=1 Tax=Streptomyces sp. NPDC088775 TaxID=3365896 RepID=UPI0037F48885
MDHEVTWIEFRDGQYFSKDLITGTDANAWLRGMYVSGPYDLHRYESADRRGKPLRVIALVNSSWSGRSGALGHVFTQDVTGTKIEEYDWFEGAAPTPPSPDCLAVKVGGRVYAMPDGSRLAAGLVVRAMWEMRPAQGPYCLAPLWTWGWHVTVRFGDGKEHKGFWHSDWVSKPKSGELVYPQAEAEWQELEVAFAMEQQGE